MFGFVPTATPDVANCAAVVIRSHHVDDASAESCLAVIKTIFGSRPFLLLQSVDNGLLPARRYASAVFATATCPSVCPDVRLSHAGIVPSRAKAGS